jgi:sulfur-carrier protein adenylyltransferase/sulfurtransferase
MKIAEISSETLVKKMKRKDDFTLLDVREDWEREICKILGSVQISVKELDSRHAELPKNKEIIIYCHSGNRSILAANILTRLGFDAKSLAGGIDRWAEKIDKKMKRY